VVWAINRLEVARHNYFQSKTRKVSPRRGETLRVLVICFAQVLIAMQEISRTDQNPKDKQQRCLSFGFWSVLKTKFLLRLVIGIKYSTKFGSVLLPPIANSS